MRNFYDNKTSNLTPKWRKMLLPLLVALMAIMLGMSAMAQDEIVTTTPEWDGSQIINICVGGTVTVQIANSQNGNTYRIRKTAPSPPVTIEELPGNGNTITFSPIDIFSAIGNYTIAVRDVTDDDPDFTFTVVVTADPVAPTLTPSPATGFICPGTSVSAAFLSSGSGGITGSADSYEYRINGEAWQAYTLGNSINDNNTNLSVDIRALRQHPDGLGCFAENIYSWTYDTKVQNTTLDKYYCTIQEAIDDATEGNTIVVSAGTYAGNITLNKNIELIGAGAGVTIIIGNNAGSELGAIHLTSGRNGVTIKGFHVKGIDNTNPGIEKAAIYLQGAQMNIIIEENIIEALGDAALQGEWNAANDGITINNNQFTGQTFIGAEPATGDQFTVWNVARQAINFGGGTGTTNTKNFTFTNNIIATIAAGTTAGNTLVTLDLVGTNTISGNTFSGKSSANALRIRGNGSYEIEDNYFTGTYPTAIFRQGAPVISQDNWFGSDTYADIFAKIQGPVVFVPYYLDANGSTSGGGPTNIDNLVVTYTEGNKDIFVKFDVKVGDMELQPMPGLNPADPNYQAQVAARYAALEAAIVSGVPAAIQAAALAVGDDVIIEYYYYVGTTKTYLQTINNNPLVKSKYWQKFLVRDDNVRFPSWPGFPGADSDSRTSILKNRDYRTHTNPGTGAVAANWLDPALGRDVYVTVTLIQDGSLSSDTKIVNIPAGPVNVYSGEPIGPGTFVASYLTIQAAIDAATTLDGYFITVDAGTYAENLLVNKRLTIQGAGPDLTTVQSVVNGIDVIRITKGGTDAANRTVIKNLKVATTGTGNNINGIRIDASGGNALGYITIENVHGLSLPGNAAGVLLHGTTVATDIITDVKLIDVNFAFNNFGVYSKNAQVHGFTVDGDATRSKFEDNRHSGILFEGNGSLATQFQNFSIKKTDLSRNNSIGDTDAGRAEMFLLGFNGDLTMEDVVVTSGLTTAKDVPWYAAVAVNGKYTSGAAPSGNMLFKNVIFNSASDAVHFPRASLGIWTFSNLDAGVTIDNCQFNSQANGTHANNRGGLYLFSTSGNTPLVVKNSTFSGNYWYNGFANDICMISSPVNVTATEDNTFTGAAGNFAIENRIYHAMDNLALGLVTWVPSNVFVTTNTLGIQRGIDVVPNSTVNVGPGTFNESVTVNKSLSLIGSGCGQTIWRGSTITDRSLLIVRNNTVPANVHVEITGFSFETENNQTIRGDWSASYNEALTLDIHDNCFKHVNTRNPGIDFALYVDGALQTPRGTQGAIRAYNNLLDVVTGGFLFEYCRAVDVINNEFNVTYEGVAFNNYSVTATIGDHLVDGNTFNRIGTESAFAMNNWHGTGTYTLLPSTFTNNLITNSGFSYAWVCGVQANQSPQYTLNGNAFLSGTIMGWGDYFSQANIDATNNWWGTTIGNDIAPRIASGVDYSHWLVPDPSGSTYPWSGGYKYLPAGTLTTIESAIPTNGICGTGGSIAVTFSGGTANYIVSWTDGINSGSESGIATSPYTITDLAGGTYTITVTDAYGSFDVVTGVVVNYLPVTLKASDASVKGYYASIQPAINAAVDGDEVHICAGTFVENNFGWTGLRVQNKSIKIIGAGSGLTTVKVANLTNGIEFQGNISVWVEGITFTKDGTTGPGFFIRLGEVASTYSSVTMKDLVVEYAEGRNIFFGSNGVYDPVLIEDCIVRYAKYWGLSLANPTVAAKNFSIINSSFINNGLAVDVNGIGCELIHVNGFTISGSDFSNNPSSGLSLQRATNGIVSNILIENVGDVSLGMGNRNAVAMWEWLGSSSNIQFINPTIKNNNSRGIMLGTEAAGNAITGFSITGGVFSNNAAQHLLLFELAGGPISGVSLTSSSLADGSIWGNIPSNVDLSCNWWGTTDYATINGKIGLSSKTFQPYLIVGTEEPGEETTPGFQPVTPNPCALGTVAFTATPDHVLCGETVGSIEVEISGGTPPYNIEWTGGSDDDITSPYTITGLSAGNYDITVYAIGSQASGSAEVKYLPVYNSTALTYHPTIQAAIDDATAGDVIEVCAGTYVETIGIDKAITLKGPNYGKNPNVDTRVAEAVVEFTNWYGVYFDVADVTIDGFTFDGKGTCDYGIYTYMSGVGGHTFSNNIVKGTKTMGYLGWVQTGNSSSDNLVTKNLFKDMPNARAIVTLWNYYANVTDNVIQNTSVGIYAENANKPESTGLVEWKNNTISATRAGIWYNLAYGTATSLTIKDNIIDVEDNTSGTRWDGIWLTSLGGSISPVISGNTITGGAVTQQTNGYNLWNNTTNAADGIKIQGGKVSDVGYGVWINNWDGYPTIGGSNAGTTSALIDGVIIDNASIAGVYLKDNPLNTSGASAFVYAKVTNSTIKNSEIGILLEGEDASANVINNPATITGNQVGIRVKDGASLASVTGNTITNNTHGGIIIESTAGTIGVINNNTISENGYTFDAIHGLGLKNDKTSVVNAKNNWWGHASGPYHSVYNTCGAGNAVVGLVDISPWLDGDNNPVELLVHNVDKGTYYCKIQDAINDAGEDETIVVGTGTFVENIIINKANLTLKNASNPVIDGGGNGTVVTITANGVTFEGFTVQNSGNNQTDVGILLNNVTGCTIKGNLVTGNANGIALAVGSGNFIISNEVKSNSYYGIALAGSANNQVNLNEISENVLDAIALDNASLVGGPYELGSTGNHFKTNTISSNRDGIFFGVNCSGNFVTDGNVIDGATSIGISMWKTGSQTITGNTIKNSAAGIRLLGSSNNTITGNTITDNVDGIKVHPSWQSGNWIQCTNNTISNNKIFDNTSFGLYAGDDEQTSIITATLNYWGATSGPTYAGNPCGTGDEISDNVLYDCWWGNDDMDQQVCQLQAFNVTGTGSICLGANGTITLSGSQYGINYEYTLYKDNVPVDNSMQTGTGNALTWTVSPTANATYTVKAKNTLNDCELDMNGSATIYLGPTTIAPEIVGCPGTIIEFPITVQNFKQVSSVSLQLIYSTAVMTYHSYTTDYPDLVQAVNEIEVAPDGRVVIAGNSLTTLDLPDNTVLLTLKFNYLGGTTQLVFDDRGANQFDDTWCEYGYGIPGQYYIPFCDGPSTYGNDYPNYADPDYYVNGKVTQTIKPIISATLTGPSGSQTMVSGGTYLETTCSDEPVTTSAPGSASLDPSACGILRIKTVYTTTLSHLPPTQTFDMPYAQASLLPPTTISPQNFDGVARVVEFVSTPYYDVDNSGSLTPGDLVGDPMTFTLTVNPLPVITEIDLVTSIDETNWTTVDGALNSGYTMCIDPANQYHYLDIASLAGLPYAMNANLASNAFYLDVTSLPTPVDFYAYWAAKGVYNGCTGTWQPTMWSIISGADPMFYIKNTGSGHKLIDGLQYLAGSGENSLRVSGDYPPGTYTFTGTVTDVNGCVSFPISVSIKFDSAPVITCPANITVANDQDVCGATVSFAATATGIPVPQITYNISGTAITSPYLFPIGTTTVEAVATNDCGTKTCEFTVTVNDTQNPVIPECPPNISIKVNESSNPAVTGFATASDNCGVTVTFTDVWTAGTCPGTGVITRTWKAQDASNNSVTCVQTITIIDTQTPAITCPVDIVVENDEGECSAVVTFNSPVSLDPGYFEGWEAENFVTGDVLGWTKYNSNLASVASGTGGITSFAGSRHGLITLPDAGSSGVFSRIGGYNNSFCNGYKVSLSVYMDLADPAVVDNTYGWDLSVASSKQDGGHLRDFIFHTASNANGQILVGGSNNTNYARRNDLASINHHVISTSGWYIFEWEFRNQGGALAVDLNLLDAGGNHLWTETRFNEADLIATVVGGNRYMWFTFLATESLAIDNAKIERYTGMSSDYASGSVFPVGETIVTYTSTDCCTNTAQCTFKVTVNDTEKPVLTLPPGDLVLECYNEAAVEAWIATASATDNCTQYPVITSSYTQPANSCPQVVEVTFTATDAANNSTTATKSFELKRTTKPAEVGDPVATSSTVACPSQVIPPVNLPVVKDVCGVTLVAPTPTVSTLPTCEGMVTYTYVYEDCADLEFTWIYTYTIEHNTAPVVPANPQPLVVECEAQALPSTPPPDITDQCGVTVSPVGPFAGGTATSLYNVGFDEAVVTGPNQAPGVWYTDRYEPYGFESPELFNGNNRLKHSIDASDGANNRPGAYNSAFYNTQGRKYDLNAHTTYAEIDLYIPAGWATTGRRMAGFWGTGYNVNNAVSAYPIVEFTSDGGTARFRAWESSGGWVDMGTVTTFDTWVTLSIELLPDGEFLCKAGSLQYTTTSMGATASARIANVILQGHNTTEGVTYDIYWDNFAYQVCQGTKTFTWKYTDCAGLTSEWVETYNIVRTIAPAEFEGPVAKTLTVSCPAAAEVPPAILPVVKDVCGVTLPHPTPVVDLIPECEGEVTYTYNYVDCAGLQFQWVYTYTIDYSGGLTAPEAGASTVSCPLLAVDPDAPDDITDACGRTVEAVLIGYVDTPDPLVCEGTRVYTYRYTACDGTTTADWTYTYTIDNNTKPTLVCPTVEADGYDRDLACSWVGTGLAPVTLIDACGGVPTLYYKIGNGDYVPGNANGYQFPSGNTLVTYKAVDCAGNEETCTFNIYVKPITLSGNIRYHNPSGPIPLTEMNGTTVTLKQTGFTDMTTTADANGDYHFADICLGTWEVNLSTTKAAGGVNATDAAMVNFWGTGSNAYNIQKVNFYAGDVNASNRFESVDPLRIQTYFLTLGNPTWENRGLWTFWLRDDLISVNPESPSPGVLYPNITVASGDAALTRDFWALSTGDFNGSWTPAAKSASKTLNLNYGETTTVDVGSLFELPLVAEMDMEVGAISLILNIPSDKLHVNSITLANDPTAPVAFELYGNELRIGWYSLTPLNLAKGDRLLTMHFTLKQALGEDELIYISLAADPLNELANGNYSVIPDAELMVNTIKSSAVGLPDMPAAPQLSIAIHPNPFLHTTRLYYSIPVGGDVIIDVYNLLGVKIKTLVSANLAAGDYVTVIDAGTWRPGVYTATIRLQSGELMLNSTIKVIRQQ